MNPYKQVLNTRQLQLKNRQTAKEIIEENLSWLSREQSSCKIKIRLIDLSSILDYEHDDIEGHVPIEDAIHYAASGEECISEMIDTVLSNSETDNRPLDLNNPKIEKLADSMLELNETLCCVPGYVDDTQPRPNDNYCYYFLGVTNLGKGLIACLSDDDEPIPTVTGHNVQKLFREHCLNQSSDDNLPF
jgi:hypothetical protein